MIYSSKTHYSNFVFVILSHSVAFFLAWHAKFLVILLSIEVVLNTQTHTHTHSHRDTYALTYLHTLDLVIAFSSCLT